MKKNPGKTAQTKAALKTAFWALYRDGAITKITVQDVTNLAGFNRSTFYQYFTDVHCLLKEIEDDIIQDWESTLSEIPFHNTTGQIASEEAVLKIASFHERNGEYISALLSPKGDPAFIYKLKNAMRPKIYSLLQITEDTIEVTLAFEFVSSGILAYLSAWYENAKQLPLKDAVALLHSLFSGNIMEIMFLNGKCVKD